MNFSRFSQIILIIEFRLLLRHSVLAEELVLTVLILRRGHLKGGPAGILASMTRGSTGADRANAPASGMKHILSNVYLDVNGDTATAMSRWTLFVPTEDNRTRVGGIGRYGDELVREDGEWKFQRRVIYRDIPVIDAPRADPATN
jgi:hypothetical protein